MIYTLLVDNPNLEEEESIDKIEISGKERAKLEEEEPVEEILIEVASTLNLLNVEESSFEFGPIQK